MAVDDPTTIDIIANRPGERDIQLVIADHLAWDDVIGHWAFLQEKLNAYVDFIESGEAAARPEVQRIEAPIFCVRVVGLYDQPPQARQLMDRARAIIQQLGHELVFEHRAADGGVIPPAT